MNFGVEVVSKKIKELCQVLAKCTDLVYAIFLQETTCHQDYTVRIQASTIRFVKVMFG
jgi:hypothetical protein